jgi:hypothetical protein
MRRVAGGAGLADRRRFAHAPAPPADRPWCAHRSTPVPVLQPSQAPAAGTGPAASRYRSDRAATGNAPLAPPAPRGRSADGQPSGPADPAGPPPGSLRVGFHAATASAPGVKILIRCHRISSDFSRLEF